MELNESPDTINRQLREVYGIDTGSGNPMYRVVFSDDQFEKRTGLWRDFDKNDTLIREVRETRLVPKYYNVKGKYVLENLVGVPEVNKSELNDLQVSYEPVWVFEHAVFKTYLPPYFEGCQFIIGFHQAAKNGPKGFMKYKDEIYERAAKDPKGLEFDKITRLVEDLFGDETPIGDALAYKSGVGYTGKEKPLVSLN